MTDIQKLYQHYYLNNTATNQDVCNAFGWDEQKVRTYKYRLKKKGYIAIDHEDGKEIIVCLREPDDRANQENRTIQYKQEAYRNMADAYLERMMAEGTTVSQMIELGRELRLILKEIA